MSTLHSSGQGTAVGEGQSFLIMRLWRAGCCALAAVIAIVATTGPAGAQCMYEVTIIRAPVCPGGGVPEQPGTVAEDISDTGVVVGWYRQCEINSRKEAFRWSEQSGFETLPRPTGVTSAQALAVSRDGSIIVGQMTVQGAAAPNVAFVFLNGQMVNLGTLSGHHRSYASAARDAGLIVGESQDLVTGPIHAAKWVNQSVQQLPAPPDLYSSAQDVNQAARIVGHIGFAGIDSSAAVWQDSSFESLITPPIASAAAGHCSNNNNTVGGRANIPDGGGGFDPSNPAIWQAGVVQVLEMLPESIAGWLTDVNDPERPVGLCRNQSTVVIGTAWFESEAINLNDLVSENPQVTLIKGANAIANDGRIIATIRTLISGVSGEVTGLLTPVDSAPSDLNHDCITDIFDLFLLLGEWNSGDSFADIDDSGVVDVFDLFVLLDGWG